MMLHRLYTTQRHITGDQTELQGCLPLSLSTAKYYLTVSRTPNTIIL